MADGDSRDYSIGYGKPPVGTRFRKGESGNPKGRPRGARNLSTIMERALNERVTVTENGHRRSITKREAMAKQLVNKGAKGEYKAIQVLLNYQVQLENRAAAAAGSVVPQDKLDEVDEEVLKGIFERSGFEQLVDGGEEDGNQGNGSES